MGFSLSYFTGENRLVVVFRGHSLCWAGLFSGYDNLDGNAAQITLAFDKR